jgi:hypothetical protein
LNQAPSGTHPRLNPPLEGEGIYITALLLPINDILHYLYGVP